MRWCLRNGVDPARTLGGELLDSTTDGVTYVGQTYLHRAIERNKPDEIIALIAESSGALVDARTEGRLESALYLAVQEHYRPGPVVAILLAAGADPNLRAASNFGPHVAGKAPTRRTGSQGYGRVGLESIDEPVEGYFSIVLKDIVLSADEDKHLGVTYKGPKIAFPPRTYGGPTPLQLSVNRGLLDVARALLDGGADPEDLGVKRGLRVSNPKLVSVMETDVVGRLTNYEFEEWEVGGFPPGREIAYAVESGQLELVKLLLNRGASLDSYLDHYWPSFVSSAEVLEFLIDEGAGLRATDGAGRNALQIAIDICLMDSGPARGRNLKEASYPLIEQFLELGFDPTQRDNLGRNAAHAAASNKVFLRTRRGIDLLITLAGNALNARTAAGRTPLMLACLTQQRGILPVARLLIEAGAKPNIKDGDGRNVLYFCLDESGTNLEELLPFLFERGADPRVLDNAGQTPAQYTLENSSFYKGEEWLEAVEKFFDKYR